MNNYKKLINNIFGSFLVKGLSIVVSFFTIPAYIKYFNDSSTSGVWLSLVGILTWITIFDLGIGNGLRNSLVKYFDKDDIKVREYISSAYFIISIIAFFIVILGIITINIIDWNNILNISNNVISNDTLIKVTSWIFIGISVYFVVKLIGSILLSIEKTALVNFLQLVTSLLNLIYILLIKESVPSIALFKLARFYVISLNLPYIIVTIYLFCNKLRKYIPSIKYVKKSIAFNITFLGSEFFIIQLMLLVINSSNEFLITYFYGPSYVIEYQIYYKVFYLTVSLYSLITNPIWSNIAVAYNKSDFIWIEKIRKKLLFFSMIASLFIILIIFVFPFIAKIWLGDIEFAYNIKYGSIFALFSILMVLELADTSIANGMNRLKPQLVFFSIGAIIKIPLTILLKNIGVEWIGIIIINVFILILFNVFQYKDLNKFLLKKLSSRNEV